MGVYLEGGQVDTVTTATRETVARTYRVDVGDGQLNLRLADLGGTDIWAMIIALDVVFAGPDLSGPRVLSADPRGAAIGPADRIRLSFNEMIDPSSFTLTDVVLLDGPSGDTPLAINSLGSGEFEVVFAPHNTPGTYRLAVGPGIADVSGNVMDQDQDGAGGENPDDQFEVTFSLEPGPEYVARFDFGTTDSPGAEGYTRLTRSERYSSAVGYGWQLGSVYSLDRRIGDDLMRDFNYTKDATFAMDLANGQYDVIVTLGDTAAAHDQMGVYLEGGQVDTVTTATRETVARTYRVDVGDGQLNLRLADLGGTDIWAMIIALDVVFIDTNIETAAIAEEFVSGRVWPFDNQCVWDFESGSSPTPRANPWPAREKAFSQLISKLSGPRPMPPGYLDHETREKALTTLFNGARQRESEETRFVWAELVWEKLLAEPKKHR